MRVIFMGTPDFAVAALRRLSDHHQIAAVYTQPARAAGRGQKARPGPVAAFAAEHRFEVRTPPSLKPPDVQAAFSALAADIAVVAAYGLILPRPVLSAPRLGCINIHASLLPRWRGAAPIQRAIMAGDAETGVTIMQLEAGLDTGPMLLKAAVPITESTTAGDLHDQLSTCGADLVLDALDRLAAGSLTPVAQPSDGITHAAKIEKAEAKIDFARPAAVVLRHIHGLSPFPGAWFEVNGERIKVLRCVMSDGAGAPGTVLDDALKVATAAGAIRLTQLQRAGRAPMDAAALLRGFRLPEGTSLA
ncbi:MAG: methionyl-tRNA formyltransferase [Alphaproteobacteria bacterium]|nr:methionyl-tRNA formyltransferase [Alphaproteobacteria bacterium]